MRASPTRAAAAACELINNCALVVTDQSGLEFEELVYQEIGCAPDASAADLACSCRVRTDRHFTFRGSVGDDPPL